MKYYYTALFTKEDEGYTVTIPAIEEVVTYGKTMQEAIKMAKECLGMCLETRLEEGMVIPEDIDAITGDIVSVIEIEIKNLLVMN